MKPLDHSLHSSMEEGYKKYAFRLEDPIVININIATLHQTPHTILHNTQKQVCFCDSLDTEQYVIVVVPKSIKLC